MNKLNALETLESIKEDMYEGDYEILLHALTVPTKEEMKYDVLQYFSDLSRGKLFEYNGIQIFYNNEYETFSLDDEQNVVPVQIVYDLMKSLNFMKASDE